MAASKAQYNQACSLVSDLADAIYGALVYAGGDDEDRPLRIVSAGGSLPSEVTVDSSKSRRDEFADWFHRIKCLVPQCREIMHGLHFEALTPSATYWGATSTNMHSAVFYAAGMITGAVSLSLDDIREQLRRELESKSLPDRFEAKCHLRNEKDRTCRMLWPDAPVAEEIVPSVTNGIIPNTSFNCVTWGNEKFVFNPQQADCVRVMFDAWKNHGPWIHQREIIAAAEGHGERLRDKFKDHPAWGTMIVGNGKNSGLYGICEPPAE